MGCFSSKPSVNRGNNVDPENTQIPTRPKQEQQLRQQAQQLGMMDVIMALESGLQVEQIKKLNFKNHSLTKIPNKMSYFNNLQKFYLSYNKFTKMPNISKLQSIIILDLGFNQITKIEGLQNLVKLKELLLNDNQIEKIQNLSTLKILENLNLRNNSIKQIEGLETLSKLRTLDLSDNCISILITTPILLNLQTFDVSSNPISPDKNSQIIQQFKNKKVHLRLKSQQ